MNENERPVLTVPEIAARWRKNPVTVRRALDARRKPLLGYKSPDTERGTWLILTTSVIARWGSPQNIA